MRFLTRALTLSAITLALAVCGADAQSIGSAYAGGMSNGVVIANGRNIEASTTVHQVRDVLVGNAAQQITCDILFKANIGYGTVTKYSTMKTAMNGGGVNYNNAAAGTGNASSYLQITGSGITVTQTATCNTCTFYADKTQSCAGSVSTNVANVDSGYVLGNAISTASGSTSGGNGATVAGTDAVASGGLSAAGTGIGLSSTQLAGSQSANSNGGVLSASDSLAQQTAKVAVGGASTSGAAAAGSAVQGTNVGTSGSASGIANAAGYGAQTSVLAANNQATQQYNYQTGSSLYGVSSQNAALGSASSAASTNGLIATSQPRFSTSY